MLHYLMSRIICKEGTTTKNLLKLLTILELFECSVFYAAISYNRLSISFCEFNNIELQMRPSNNDNLISLQFNFSPENIYLISYCG